MRAMVFKGACNREVNLVPRCSVQGEQLLSPFRAPWNEATYNSWLYIERFMYSSGLTVDGLTLLMGWD